MLIKDRNGNQISVNYNAQGDILNVTDTLGRLITFNYDGNANLLSITQNWNGTTHTWASFGWGTVTMQPGFGLSAIGAQNGEVIPALTQVGLADGSHYNFEYTARGQVNVIRRYTSDNAQRSYTAYSYESPTDDCPRISAARVWAENWNGSNGVPAEATTTFEDLGIGWHRMTAPDQTAYTELYGTSSWQRGLSLMSEVWSGGVRQKWNTIDWTQDNTAVSYQTNPRVTETNTYDLANNRRRTTIDYGPYAQWGLPYIVSEYASNGTTELRRTYTDYNLNQPYLDWHIIGLVSAAYVYDPVAGQFLTKTSYAYDQASLIDPQATSATQHDQAFNNSFLVRGNVTSVSRWDVTDPNNTAKARTSTIGYDAAGSQLSTTDPAGHSGHVSYSDNFTDGSHNTFAYPTTVTDANSNNSSVQYNYYFGGQTSTQGPPPAGQSQGIIQTVSYDTAARVQRVTIANTGAYTRYDYGPNYTVTNSTVNNVGDDTFVTSVFDGAGRVFATFAPNPGSTGLYKEQLTYYDLMGQVKKQSNPTEVNASWSPAGDDAAGFLFTQQSYDWKGRPRVTTNTDGRQKSASYTACGCAGSEATTVMDEAGRQTRTTNDALGRLAKVEELNWFTTDPFDATVFSTANYSYNALDQLTSISHEGQVRSFGYDGYGRVQTRTTPEQGTTTYAYPDDTTQTVTDARGAVATYGYNSRHLLTSINYNSVSGMVSTPNVSFGYDAAGNRTSMNDGLGTVSYGYNQLSQLTSETRSFTGVGSYNLGYSYNVAGELNGMTNPAGVWMGYTYDSTGRLNRVNGDGYANVSTYAYGIAYRAFGAVKSMSYNDHHDLSTTYDNRMRPTRWSVPGVLDYKYAYDYYNEHTGRVTYAENQADGTLDRSYQYDQVGALVIAHSGAEARASAINGQWGTMDGPYSHGYDYDKFGNLTHRYGWGGEVQGGAPGQTSDLNYSYSNNKNQRDGFTYDAAGNLTNDQVQTYTYNAIGQQVAADGSGYGLQQFYDGDGLRVLKNENGAVTAYVRSTVLGGQVVAEIDGAGNVSRGYVYAGGELLAVQQDGQVYWVHEDAVTKSKRITDIYGGVVSTVELDPWGANTNRSANSAFMPHSFATYERDTNGGQDAMARRYSVAGRFSQPDPYSGSYNFTDPQSLNRYAYTRNDPVNNADPTGLMCIQYHYTNTGTGDGFWTPWYCTPGITHELQHGGGRLMEKAPQNPKEPQGTFDDAYQSCLGKLGKSIAPGLSQAADIIDVANKTAVDPTLLAVTWRFEGSLDQHGNFNFQPTNGMHTPVTQTGDVGPGQLFPDTWNKSPYTDGLTNPFGTNLDRGQVFNGNAFENLMVTGRALGTARGAQRANAAGIYRAGSSSNPGYSERVQNFKDNAGNYDRFFDCLAKKGFSP